MRTRGDNGHSNTVSTVVPHQIPAVQLIFIFLFLEFPPSFPLLTSGPVCKAGNQKQIVYLLGKFFFLTIQSCLVS